MKSDIKKKISKILQIIVVGLGMVIVAYIYFIIIRWIVYKHYTDDEYKIQILEYLNERYGEDFVIDKIEHNMYQPYAVNAIGHAVSDLDKEFCFQIQGYSDKWGNITYYDTYVMYKIKDDYEKYMSDIARKYFDEFDLHMTFYSEWITVNIPADADLEKMWDLSANVDYPLPEVELYLPPEVEISQIKDYCDSLKSSNFIGSITIRHCYTGKDYEEIMKPKPEDINVLHKFYNKIQNDSYSIYVYSDRVDIDSYNGNNFSEGVLSTISGKTYNETKINEKIIKDLMEYGAIIIDSGGDGVYTRSAENGLHYNLDNDEFIEKMSYVSKNASYLLLMFDSVDNPYGIPKDRMINIFSYEDMDNGKYIFVVDKFEWLEKLDTNGDGIINKKDEGYKHIMFWTGNYAEKMDIRDNSLKGFTEYSHFSYYYDDRTEFILDLEKINRDDENGNRIGRQATVNLNSFRNSKTVEKSIESVGMREYEFEYIDD